MVHEYIFAPLKMVNSGFYFTDLKTDEKATGYFKLDNTSAAMAPIVDSPVSFSAGAIYSTTGNLFLWHQALEANSILTKTQQDKAYTPVRNKYGYGWIIDSLEGKRRVTHGGGIHGFTTNIARVPEDDICIILLSSASDRSLEEITNTVFSALYNKRMTYPGKKQ